MIAGVILQASVFYYSTQYDMVYTCILFRRISRVCWLSIYTSAACMNVNTANQTSDILQYPMNNKFIMYCSCVNTIVTSFLYNKHLYNLG